MTKGRIPTIGQLRRLLMFWQKVLRLQDWHISIRYAKGGEIENPTAMAQNAFDLAHKRAIILMLHPNEWAEARVDRDVEDSLVHELLHLHISPAVIMGCHDGKPEIGSTNEEVAISLISEALVKLKRAI